MPTTEPTTEAGKLRARIEKDAQEINARANHFESLRVVNALAAFGLDACQAGIEATGRLTEAEAALSQFTPERIAEALDGVLPRMAFIQYAEPLYGLDWEPDAYYLRVATEVLAALTEKPQETPE
jgi:hypothetical protein